MQHFNSVSEFLAMGGYACYVWSAYGMVFLVFLALVLFENYRKKHLIKQYHRWRNQHPHNKKRVKISHDGNL